MLFIFQTVNTFCSIIIMFLIVVISNNLFLSTLEDMRGDGSSARNSSARKPVFQANFQISFAVFETCTADTYVRC
jgi:hypothetical protein